MKNLNNELQKLDSILNEIAQKEGYFIREDELKKNKIYEKAKIDFLLNENLIEATSTPVFIKLTQKGIIFISKGGFTKENKNLKLNKTSNIVYLLATPFIALISVVLSIIALNISSPKEIKWNNNLQMNAADSCWILKDTSINEIEIIEKYSFSKNDTTDVKELIKRQTITRGHSQ